MPTVYVTQIPHRRVNGAWMPAINIAPASAFGSLRVIIPNGPTMIDSSSVVESLAEELLHYNHADGDSVLLTGDPAIIAAAGLVLGWLEHDRVRLLKWESNERTYIPVEVTNPITY